MLARSAGRVAPERFPSGSPSGGDLGLETEDVAALHADLRKRLGVEELFAANDIGENLTLQSLQNMPMAQRRHSTVILFGHSFQTFTPMQAFQQSVHAVINASELFLLKQLIEKAVADNTLFLHSYREAQSRVFATEAKEA